MQALSQLSYGPTLLLPARHSSVDLPEWPAFVKRRHPTNGRMLPVGNDRWSLHRLMSGVPTGIRTPVATVKG